MKKIAVICFNKKEYDFFLRNEIYDVDHVKFHQVSREEQAIGMEFVAFIRIGSWNRMIQVDRLIDFIRTRIRPDGL